MITCTFEDGNKAETGLRHVVADCLVIRGDEILLAKRTKKLLEAGKWSLVGGFIGHNETIEVGARREILEETGYTVKDLTLLRIIDNPNRPAEDRQNIAFVYCCQVDKKEGSADWESDDQKWFKLSNIPPKDQIAFDHWDNIKLYLKWLEYTFPTPLLG